jgi:hypothetical protein
MFVLQKKDDYKTGQIYGVDSKCVLSNLASENSE